MKLQISKSKNAVSYYVTKSIFLNGKSTSKVVEKLGTHDEVLKRSGGEDPETWARSYVAKLTQMDKKKKKEAIVKFSTRKMIGKDRMRSFNGGYLFLQKIYHELRLHKICSEISSRHRFDFDLDAILSRLLYCRIIYPSSKLATYIQSAKLLEHPGFDIQHVYRALDVISEELDFIQSELYKNSLKAMRRNTGVLYYDCTNYFFEIEQEAGLRQYGYGKDHKPNPIVQMGLFIDGDGIPLAFNVQEGNTNEQITMTPLEEKILSDFGASRFVVCTDAGLSSEKNRRFNDRGGRAFITTQSVKKMKGHLIEWALDASGWNLPGSYEKFDITSIDEGNCRDKTFYKERWIKENGMGQRLIVTYSTKYRDYQRHIRNSQIDRAIKLLEEGSSRIKKPRQNDYKRFIEEVHCTADGEMADRTVYQVKEKLVAQEEAFDGFYAICTNLEDSHADIIKVNRRRWEIEECFRIMKSEFKARPVYLSKDARIRAHFATCFLSLVIYRLLEKRLGDGFTCREIISGLKEMDFFEIKGEGFIPTYTRSDFTDALHEAFGFRTDYECTTYRDMKKIFRTTKK
jgi:transposase